MYGIKWNEVSQTSYNHNEFAKFGCYAINVMFPA